MASKHNDYKPLAYEDEHNFYTTTQRLTSSTPTNKILILLLIISSLGHLLWPIILASYFQHGLNKTCNFEVSPYAGLTYDIPTPFRDIPTFVHRNSVVADATWDSWSIEPGFVALTHEFVNGKMLPEAQKSPLDDDKGVYLLSSYHSLHCLVNKIDAQFRFLTNSL